MSIELEFRIPGRLFGAEDERAFATWCANRDGVPKVYPSTQAAGQRPGAHAEYVEPAEFARFLRTAPDAPFHCMLEARAKDRALFRCARTSP